MKKTIILVALALFPLTSFAAFDSNLKYSASGPAVVELQEFLTSHNYYAGPISGYFYSLTLAGVKAYQAANNLPSSGYFGPMSRAEANVILTDDLATSTTQELTETGTTSAPIVAPIETPPVQNQVVPPTFSGTITSPAPMPQDLSAITVKVATSGGRFTFSVSVLGSDGNAIQNAPIHMEAPDLVPIANKTGITDRFATDQDGNPPQNNWYTTFSYGGLQVLTKGSQDITFTSGNLTKTITINVQ